MSYKFFQNTSCEYFPCHKTNKTNDFNCLFCFCPLYSRMDCGGNFSMIDGKIKDCTNCVIPHSNYEYIIEKLNQQNK